MNQSEIHDKNLNEKVYRRVFPYAYLMVVLYRYMARESEPDSWEDTMTDELEREKYPRMPWHDVQCALWGPPCRDVARHFVQRWNHAKVS